MLHWATGMPIKIPRPPGLQSAIWALGLPCPAASSAHSGIPAPSASPQRSRPRAWGALGRSAFPRLPVQGCGESGAAGKGRDEANRHDKERRRQAWENWQTVRGRSGNWEWQLEGRPFRDLLAPGALGCAGALAPLRVPGGLRSRPPRPSRAGRLGLAGFGGELSDSGILGGGGAGGVQTHHDQGAAGTALPVDVRSSPAPLRAEGICFPTRLFSPPPSPAPGSTCAPRFQPEPPLLRRRPGAGHSRARDSEAASAGPAGPGGGGPTELPEGATKGSQPAPRSAVWLRPDKGLGRGGAGRAAEEVISLPLPRLPCAPLPLPCAHARPAPAAAPPPPPQHRHHRRARAVGPKPACAEAGWAAGAAAAAQVRRADLPSRPRRSCDAPGPLAPRQPSPARVARAGSAARPGPRSRAGRSEPHPGRAPGSGPRGREWGGGRRPGARDRQVRGTWAAPRMPTRGGTFGWESGGVGAGRWG